MTQRLTCHTTTERDEERETGREKIWRKTTQNIDEKKCWRQRHRKNSRPGVVIMHNTRRAHGKRNFHFLHQLRSVFAFVNHGHVIASALAPHSRARSSSIERESERREKTSRNSERNGTMRKKCWHWQFAREACKATGVLHKVQLRC